MNKAKGIAATGHVETSRAAAEILRAGGNAFDAAVAAMCTGCVAEPTMISLGGGGFMLQRSADGSASVYDFFCQTPAHKIPGPEMEFFPILANFGNDTQEFHVGKAAIAVPGLVAGMFEIHRDKGRMPIEEIFQPAIELARRGVRVTALHQFIVRILEAIMRADDTLFSMFRSPSRPDELIFEGEYLKNPMLADALVDLAHAGPDLFYRGAWAEQMAVDCREGGGHLSLADLAAYRVEQRKPVRFKHSGAQCLINSPPSPGGCLIAFTLGMLNEFSPSAGSWGDTAHVQALVTAFRAASQCRANASEQVAEDATAIEQILNAENMARWRSEVQWNNLFSRGTAHMSIADAEGNVVSLTASNGEGNTYVLPGTGIILNNMLGEEDLMPGGFHQWRENSRLASMMSPTIAECPDGSLLALGTGGSNRIRSAITQVLVNVLDFKLTLEQAVAAPRLHLEGEKLSIEAGFEVSVLDDLKQKTPSVHEWPGTNLFFGGVHSVRYLADGGFEAVGDPRRGGAVEIA